MLMTYRSFFKVKRQQRWFRVAERVRKSAREERESKSLTRTWSRCTCWQVRDALHVKFVPSAQNPTGQPDYEGNTYKYWHAGQNNSGWNYVSLVAARERQSARASERDCSVLAKRCLTRSRG